MKQIKQRGPGWIKGKLRMRTYQFNWAMPCLIVLALVFGVNVQASVITTFSDRTNWNIAVGGSPDFFVDFEDLPVDAIFGVAPVDVGSFSLAQSAGIPNLFDRIDVPPYFAAIAPLNSPNGTTFAMVVISRDPNRTEAEITFDEPMLAFGADFKSGAPDSVNFPQNQLVLHTASGLIITSIDTTNGFFGFIASEPFTKITVRMDPLAVSLVATFGMDNVVGGVISELINDKFSPLGPGDVTTAFDPTPCGGTSAGTFTIGATFTNTSPDTLSNLFFEVNTLTGGNVLCNADGGPGGEGSTLMVPLEGVFIQASAAGTIRDCVLVTCSRDGVPDNTFKNLVELLNFANNLTTDFPGLNRGGGQDQGIVEVDLSSVSGTVNSAILVLDLFDGGTPGGLPFDIDVFTYSGDGLLTLADWNQGLLATSFTYAGEQSVTVDLTTTVNQFILAGANVLGVNLRIAGISPFGNVSSVAFDTENTPVVAGIPPVPPMLNIPALAPGESFDVEFQIGLSSFNPFNFFVDLFGVVQ